MEHREWGRIQEIYHSALPLPPADRAAFVANKCRDDPSLAQEVNELLSADESSSGFLEAPVFEMGLQLISASEEVDDLVGTTIDGRYVVDQKLGEGGMGMVYLARDLQLHGTFVVIKVLREAVLSDPETVRRFKQEIHALTLVDHPNVVNVRGAGELPNGKPYIAMQYIDGPTLRDQIPSAGMDLQRAARILEQIGAGLNHVHHKGILHRDLKPGNIMIQVHSDGTESVKIVDFGIAKVKHSVLDSAVNNVPIGTLAYMSPEQRRAEPLSVASDVYAMAVIACEMVTGKRPENSAVLPRRPGLPVKAQQIILRCLSEKPADRYQSARQFGEDLHTALLKRPVPGPWLKAIAAVLIVSLLSFGAYKYLSSRRTALLPRQGFNYWLMVQEMHDGKPSQSSVKSNGNEETFSNGDKFQLNVFARESGYLYVFQERSPAKSGFTMVYPKNGTNNSSASIGKEQTFASDWMIFTGPPGTENFWIVWSLSPVNELESIKNQAFVDPQAALTDQNVATVKEFLNASRAKIDVNVTRFQRSQEAVVLANSNIVLTLAQFKHR